MEIPDMEEGKKDETHLSSASAFVEGGIQDSCDDACSICLEEFCESDPSTVTSCKHEFHLQCILEWCQRSSLCPMCLQPISMKDPTSQELLEAVERERNIKAVPTRNATIFHHPTLGDFELQHLPIGVSNAELEERIIQHLAAAAAAMGRTHHFGRREGQRNRTSSHGRPHFLVFSTHPGASPSNQISSSPTHDREDNRPASVTVAAPSSSLTSRGNEHSQQMLGFPVLTGQNSSASESAVMPGNLHGISFNNSSSQSSLQNHDRAGPSEFRSFSESLKSRLNAVSMRYKESISRSTRGWKERFFSRNNSLSDLGSEVRREVSASMSHMIEHLEARDNTGANQAIASTRSTDSEAIERSGRTDSDYGRECPPNEIRMTAPCAPSSAST